MSVRPFDWRDLLVLYRYRNRYVYLDTTRLLTQGPAFAPVGSIFSYFAPAFIQTTGVYTLQSKDDGSSPQVIFGQATHVTGSPSAHLAFLAPETAVESPGLLPLLEQLTVEVGAHGAYHLIAEVNEEDPVFEALRRAGFAIYARQQIWRLSGEPHNEGIVSTWKSGLTNDIISVRSLYNNLVPGLVQQVEPPPQNRLKGLVLREKDEVKGYIELKYGPHGIWVQPFIHPDLDNVSGRLAYLIRNQVYRKDRYVYLCVRSYQSWLEPALVELGAEVRSWQAVMVKRLSLVQKARAFVVPAVERGHPEISAPVTHSESNPEVMTLTAPSAGESDLGRVKKSI
jgi:hypothetical protein